MAERKEEVVVEGLEKLLVVWLTVDAGLECGKLLLPAKLVGFVKVLVAAGVVTDTLGDDFVSKPPPDTDQLIE